MNGRRRALGKNFWVVFLVCFIAPHPAPAQETAPEALPPVLATVNGKPITEESFLELWRQTASQGIAQDGPQPEELNSLRSEVLDRLITWELLDQKADELGIRIKSREIKERLQELQGRYGGQEALDDALLARGLSGEVLLRDIRRALRAQRVLEREVFDGVSVAPEEAEAFYEANSKAFQVPEQIRARHIVVRVPSGATEAERHKALRTIKRAKKRIRNGEPFAKVAKEVSDDRSASRGGDMGYFHRGQMPPEFEEVAFALEAGEVSDIVETLSGYHLLMMEEKHPPRTVPFEKAAPDIRKYLTDRKKAEAARLYTESLREQAEIQKEVTFAE